MYHLNTDFGSCHGLDTGYTGDIETRHYQFNCTINGWYELVKTETMLQNDIAMTSYSQSDNWSDEYLFENVPLLTPTL